MPGLGQHNGAFQQFFNFSLGTQIHDLVSQIKVPVTLPSQPVSKTLLTTNPASVIGTSVGTGGGIGVSPGGEKRRKIEIINRRTPVTVTTSTGSNNGGIAIVNSGPPASTIQSHNNTKTRRLLTTSTNAVTTQIVVEDASVRHIFVLIPFLHRIQ